MLPNFFNTNQATNIRFSAKTAANKFKKQLAIVI
jgi:hypothetical protein